MTDFGFCINPKESDKSSRSWKSGGSPCINVFVLEPNPLPLFQIPQALEQSLPQKEISAQKERKIKQTAEFRMLLRRIVDKRWGGACGKCLHKGMEMAARSTLLRSRWEWSQLDRLPLLLGGLGKMGTISPLLHAPTRRRTREVCDYCISCFPSFSPLSLVGVSWLNVLR